MTILFTPPFLCYCFLASHILPVSTVSKRGQNVPHAVIRSRMLAVEHPNLIDSGKSFRKHKHLKHTSNNLHGNGIHNVMNAIRCSFKIPRNTLLLQVLVLVSVGLAYQHFDVSGIGANVISVFS